MNDNGLIFEINSNAKKVDDFLNEQGIILGDHDLVYPSRDEKIYSGAHVIIQRAKKIIVKEGGNVNQIYTLQNSVEKAIWENKNNHFELNMINN